MQKFLKIVIGLVLFPFAVISVISFFLTIKSVPWLHSPHYLLLLGFCLYTVIFSVIKGESFAYVFGHEAVHMISSWLCGGRIISIFVSNKKGNVKTTKDNFFITLAPYFLPFYGIVLTLLYCFISIFAPVRRYIPVFIFLCGYSLAHHICFTIHYLSAGQADIKSQGRIFSFSLISLANIIIFVILLDIFIPAFPKRLFWHYMSQGTDTLFFR